MMDLSPTHVNLPSMASNTLRRRTPTKHQIAHKRAYRDRKHDPAIICHEQQPVHISTISLPFKPGMVNLHDKERVKHLHRVESALNNLHLLL
jgi:hypothetical protein